MALCVVGALAWVVLEDDRPVHFASGGQLATDLYGAEVDYIVREVDGLDVYLLDGSAYSVIGEADPGWSQLASARGVPVEQIFKTLVVAGSDLYMD